MNLLDTLFGFNGRINRAKFWLALVIWIVFFVVVIVVTMIIAPSMSAVFGVALVAYIPIIISGLAVGIKRLHDRNKSGWWLLLFYGVPHVLPFVGTVFSGAGSSPDALPTGVVILQYISFAISLWALVEFGFLRGSIGPNPYGPDPVAPQLAKH